SSGAPGTTVTIGGTNFTGASSVKFGGMSASFNVSAEGQLTATVPAGAASGPVTVITPTGTATSTASFIVTAGTPAIKSMSPGSGPAGSTVTIGGENLRGATSVTFNGIAAGFTITEGVITAVVPAGATTGPVTVTTPNGTATGSASFTVTH